MLEPDHEKDPDKRGASMACLRRAPAICGSATGTTHSRVTFVELFFDLVFVFAVTQLSHGLLEHLTSLGALQTAFLMLAVWWVWIDTSWFTNWLDPESRRCGCCCSR